MGATYVPGANAQLRAVRRGGAGGAYTPGGFNDPIAADPQATDPQQTVWSGAACARLDLRATRVARAGGTDAAQRASVVIPEVCAELLVGDLLDVAQGARESTWSVVAVAYPPTAYGLRTYTATVEAV